MNPAAPAQAPQDPILKIVLPLSQLNILLKGASNLPWNEVNGVIGNVHGQVGAQLNPEPETAPAAPDKASRKAKDAEPAA